MRRVVSLILALGLTVGGGVGFVRVLFSPDDVPRRILLGFGFIFVLGVAWLLSDFLQRRAE